MVVVKSLLLVVCSLVIPNARFTQGLEGPFTKVPKNPTYVVLGSDVELEWGFPIGANFQEVKIEYVDSGGSSTALVIKAKDGTVTVNTFIVLPKNLTSRVTIKGNATFVISNVQLEDLKYSYSCSYVPTSGPAWTEAAVKLNLFVPAKNLTVTPKCLVGTLGQTAALECRVDGQPLPELYWENGYNNETVKNGTNTEIIREDGFSRLTFKQVTSTDHGMYTCKVQSNGIPKSKSGVLAVSFCEERGNVSPTYIAGVGMTALLVCPVYGFPQPKVTWIYPNGSSKSSTRITSLLISVKREEDFGKYKCYGCGKTFDFQLQNLLSSTPTVPGGEGLKSCRPEHIALGILIPVLVIINIILAVFLYRGGEGLKHKALKVLIPVLVINIIILLAVFLYKGKRCEEGLKNCLPEHIALATLIPVLVISIIILVVLWWKAMKEGKGTPSEGVEIERLNKEALAT